MSVGESDNRVRPGEAGPPEAGLPGGGAGSTRAEMDRLLPLVYAELKRIAATMLERERPDHTLQPTALVHEVYCKLIGQRTHGWNDKAQFLQVAAKAMRRLLVDHVCGRKAQKRGGGQGEGARTLDAGDLLPTLQAFEERAIDLVALDEALEELGTLDPQKSRIVEMRFFGGMSGQEAAEALGVSLRTVDREWAFARAWLLARIADRPDPEGAP